ncbi:MAG: GAF domain-containing protein [Clostridiaceae bacterium]
MGVVLDFLIGLWMPSVIPEEERMPQRFKILFSGSRQRLTVVQSYLHESGYNLSFHELRNPDEFSRVLSLEQYDLVLLEQKDTSLCADCYTWLRTTMPDLPVLVLAQASGDEAFAGVHQANTQNVISIDRLDQLPSAIDHLLSLRMKELAALNRVAVAVMEVDHEDELIERVTNILADTFLPQLFGVLLFDPQDQVLRFHSSYRGLLKESWSGPIPLGKGVIGRVLTSRKPVYIEDVALCDYYIAGDTRIRSELCVPIQIGGQPIGVIDAESIQVHAFTQVDIDLLIALSGQLATGIERLRSNQALREKAAQLAALHSVSQQIEMAGLDSERVFFAIHQAVSQLMVCDVFAIAEWQPKRHEVEGLYLFDKGRRYPSIRCSDTQGRSGYVIHSGKSIKVDDRLKETGEAPSPINFGSSDSVRSLLMVPLHMDGQIIGTLSAQSYQPNQYSDEDLRLLQSLAGHAASAITKSHNFEIAHRQALVFANIFDAVVITDGEGRITEWNEAAETLYGYSRQEILGQTISQIHVPEMRNTLEVEILAKISSGARWQGELPYIDRNGKRGLSQVIVLPVLDGDGRLVASIGVNRDITEKRHSEEELRISQARLAGIIDSAMDAMITVDETGKVVLFNRAAERMLLLPVNQVIGAAISDFIHIDFNKIHQSFLLPNYTQEKIQRMAPPSIITMRRSNGEDFPCEISVSRVEVEEHVYLTAIIRDVGERVRVEQERTLSQRETSRLTAMVDQVEESIILTDISGSILYVNPYFERLTGYSAEEVIGETPRILKSGVQGDAFYQTLWQTISSGKPWVGRIINQRKDASFFIENATIFPIKDEEGTIINYAAVKRDITEQVQSEREMEAIILVSQALRKVETRAEMLPIILDQLLSLLNANGAIIAFRDLQTDEAMIELGRGTLQSATGTRIPEGTGISGRILRSGQPYMAANVLEDHELIKPIPLPNIRAVIGSPLIVKGETIGVVWVGRMAEFSHSEMRVLTAVVDLSANAIQRASLHEKTRVNAERMEKISAVGRRLSEMLNTDEIYPYLAQTASRLFDDLAAVVISLYSPEKRNFTCVYTLVDGQPLDVSPLPVMPLAGIGLGSQSDVITFKKPVLMKDLPAHLKRCVIPEDAERQPKAALLAPLIARGRALGVLELQSYSKDRFDLEDADLLSLMANTAAIAIENAHLYSGLQQVNLQLTAAYDKTIEGWSRALDLRDRETEGHTRRVVELTLLLADELSLTREHKEEIRRGALLHDIGKMGVPDHILNKPGPLTQDEWQIMRMHPIYAYEMLEPILFLRGALTIPRWHHEKWDGKGYPDGLVGEAIPLEARMFALADVWDAISSDRPYRKAWQRVKVINHFREQKGKHFDPTLVEVFLSLIERNLIP